MDTFEFRGLQVRYRTHGAGEPIVFLHNGGTSHAIWREVMTRLPGFQLFALDLLGYGASSKPGEGYDLGTYVDMLESFVDAFAEDRRVRLVGNCMGSAISLSYAMRDPGQVRALALFNPLTDATFTGGQLGAMLTLRKHLPIFSRAAFGAMSRISFGEALGSHALRMQLGARGVAQGLHKEKELCACYASDTQSRSLTRVLEDLPNYAALDRFAPPGSFPPICTIWGVENRVLSPAAGRRLNETLRPARQEWLDGCGHLPMLEDPERSAAILRSFFGATRLERAA